MTIDPSDYSPADIKLVGCYWPILTYGIFSKANVNSTCVPPDGRSDRT